MDKIADRYSKSPVSDEESYQKKLKVTREYLKPYMEVLEFGCGTGSTAIAHAAQVKHIQAIDISSRMIEIAQRKADESDVKNISFERSSIDEFSVSDQTLDAVLGLSILHLLEDKEEVGRGNCQGLQNAQTGRRFHHQHRMPWRHDEDFQGYCTDRKILGLLPILKVFTARELEDSLIHADFAIDHQWRPGKGKAVFIVAKKAG